MGRVTRSGRAARPALTVPVAHARLAAYLCAVGLPAADAEARALELAARADAEHGRPDGRSEVEMQIDYAVREVEMWLDDLALRCRRAGHAPPPRGLVALRVREALHRSPDFFLRRDVVPATLVRAIAALPPWIAPPDAPRPVRRQELDQEPLRAEGRRSLGAGRLLARLRRALLRG